MERLTNLEVGPQDEGLEFLVNMGSDRSSVNKYPKGCELSKQTCKGCNKKVKGESFEVPVIKEVIIRGNSKEEYYDLLYMSKLECNLLGRDLQIKFEDE